MKNINVELPHGIEAGTLVKSIDAAIQTVGLTTMIRNTLRKYPGCVHWQLGYGKKPGSIELTYWPKEDRTWVTIPDGPRADWVPEKIEEIGDLVRDRMGRQFGR